MSVPTFESQKGHNPDLIRKPLEMAIFVKPHEDGDEEVDSIYTETAGLVVPTGYMPVGLTTKDDGATWTRDQESVDTESHGYSEPTRRDIIRDVSGLGFTMQESKKTSMELYHGVSLDSVTPDADGNIVIDRPNRPTLRYWRVLAIGKDGAGPSAIYMARWLPRALVSEQPEQSWQEGEEIRYPATLTGFLDVAFGTSFREIWGGPGLDAAAMGFGA